MAKLKESKYTFEELEEKLIDKHKEFCHRWIIDYSNVNSYLEIYPNSSYGAAAVSANELLKTPKIKEYINYIKQDIAKEANISKLALINELKLIAFSNLPLILLKYEKGGLESLSPDEQKVISEYYNDQRTLGEGGEIIESKTKFKLHDKRGAIQDILKAMGWNEAENIDITTDGEKINNDTNLDNLSSEDRIKFLELRKKSMGL